MNKKDAADFMIKMLDTQGVVCSTVSDGHVLMFKRDFLEKMLEQNPEKDEFVIFRKKA